MAGTEHGKGYGAAVVEAVAHEARQHRDKWLRLNCWSTNTRLHAYYVALGFRHVRTVDVPGRMSGALFKRDLTRALARVACAPHNIRGIELATVRAAFSGG
ncbi:MAG TPA: GNAT family N-acetyltransferase [Kribbellaceae bacterium]|nr:GNAT family N-acetyltransferase [Kribbellaceae bacterium]